MTKKSNHYVDNQKFFDEMCKWKKLVIEAEEMDEPRPPVTEYIGSCFMDDKSLKRSISNLTNFHWSPLYKTKPIAINNDFRDQQLHISLV